MLELVLLDGTERRFPLADGSELTIGAAAQCSVRLNAADVSRKHAMITCMHGRTVVLDLGSTNGTFVNGKRVKECELNPGDAVRFSSIIAQVLPPASHSSSERNGNLISPRPPERRPSTSDRMPVILQESLIWLLSRWGIAEGNAVATLLEWLIMQRGMSGAAVFEEVGGEVAVRAANGALDGILDNQECHELLRAPRREAGTIDTVVLSSGKESLLAVRGQDGPLLVVRPSGSMPDSIELELFVRLLSVACLLDARVAAPVSAGRRR